MKLHFQFPGQNSGSWHKKGLCLINQYVFIVARIFQTGRWSEMLPLRPSRSGELVRGYNTSPRGVGLVLRRGLSISSLSAQKSNSKARKTLFATPEKSSGIKPARNILDYLANYSWILKNRQMGAREFNEADQSLALQTAWCIVGGRPTC